MTESKNKPKIVFWIIGIIALIWNLMGVMAYLGQAYITDEAKAAMSEVEIAYMENLPSWYTAAFAIAVFAGTIGCILLLLRKKMAYSLLLLSLLAVIAQQIYHFVLSDALGHMKTFDITMIAMIVVISIFLVWYAKNLTNKGILS
jgi:hypothetical protein